MAALPPHLSPLVLVNAGRECKVTVADHGKFLFLGNAGDGRTCTMAIQFVPDASFSGSFAVTARMYGKPASDNGVAFIDYPFRRVVLNDVASDRAVTTNTATPLVNSFIIEVPSNGVALAMLCSCTAGFGYLYSWPLNGSAT
jgi:hypothetical protein